MAPKSPKNSKFTVKPVVSRYNLIEQTNNDNNNTESHPSYEEMITLVLENNIEYGVTKQTILNRIKKRWTNIEDRYAKPWIKTTLKKMRERRKIKRTVDGLYKRSSKSRSVSPSRKSATLKTCSPVRKTLKKRTTRGRSLTKTSKKSKSRSRSKSKSKSRPSSRASSAWTNTTFKSSHKSSFAPSTSAINSEKLQNNKNNDLNNINPVKSSYFLEEDWPNKAIVTTNKNDQEIRNQIREILLKEAAVANPEGVVGLSKEHLIFEIMQNFPVGSGITYDKRRKNILKSLEKMKNSGEIIRCLNTGLFRIENKNSQILSAENMNLFLNMLKIERNLESISKEEVLYKTCKHFVNSSFQEVQAVFDDCYDDFVAGFQEGSNHVKFGSEKSCKSARSGKSSKAQSQEQISITCPCCSNDLLITINYDKY